MSPATPVAHDSAGGGQTVRLRLVVDVAPQRTALHPGPAVVGIDPHGPHRRKVDDDPVVANGGARHVVASAPYGDLEVVVAGESHGRDHVGGPDASGDQARTPVDGTVPDRAGDVVIRSVGTDQPPRNPLISAVVGVGMGPSYSDGPIGPPRTPAV